VEFRLNFLALIERLFGAATADEAEDRLLRDRPPGIPT